MAAAGRTTTLGEQSRILYWRSQSQLIDVTYRVLRERRGQIAVIILVLLAAGALFAPVLTPYHYAEQIRGAIGALPPRLREPVLLHFAEGLSYREVARTLGTGISTVARRMEKSLVRLKRSLGGEEP